MISIPLILTGAFAYDPGNEIIYALTTSNTIAEINGSSNEVVSSLTFDCGMPASIVFNKLDSRLYVGLNYNGLSCGGTGAAIVAIDPSNDSVLSNETGFISVSGMAYDSNDNLVFAEGANASGYEAVWALDASSGAVVGSIDLPFSPNNIFWGPVIYDSANGLLYFEWGSPGANNLYYLGSIAEASNYTIVGTFDPFSGDMPPSQLTYDPVTGYVYVAQSGSGGCMGYNNCSFKGGVNVTVIDGTQVINEIQVSSNPNSTLGGIAFDFATSPGAIYLINGTVSPPSFGSYPYFENITVINAANGKVMEVLSVPGGITSLYVDPAQPSYLYVATQRGLYVVPTA